MWYAICLSIGYIAGLFTICIFSTIPKEEKNMESGEQALKGK